MCLIIAITVQYSLFLVVFSGRVVVLVCLVIFVWVLVMIFEITFVKKKITLVEFEEGSFSLGRKSWSLAS